MKVILAGVYETTNNKENEETYRSSMDELWRLAEACMMEPAAEITQRLPRRNTAFYIGSGKLEELRAGILDNQAEKVIFNDTLSPSQIKNLQAELGVEVMDRTSLILEIFNNRARTREARLQVELARLKYVKPRLIGMWETQNRQGGASGSMSSKGEGETQLELDRRSIDHRLAELGRELKLVERERNTQRKKRRASGIPLVSLIGYTNAGKSTIMNAFVERYSTEDKKVFANDMLFATLDTTVRRIELGQNMSFLLSDTVGFIQKLPTSLVEAFKSTLEEVVDADLLIQVVDYSDPNHTGHMEVTQQLLNELGAGHIPMLIVYNKADVCGINTVEAAAPADKATAPGTIPMPAVLPADYPRRGMSRREASGAPTDCIYISAREAASLDLLEQVISEKLFGGLTDISLLIPYDQGALTARLLREQIVLSQTYENDGILLKLRMDPDEIIRWRRYTVTPDHETQDTAAPEYRKPL